MNQEEKILKKLEKSTIDFIKSNNNYENFKDIVRVGMGNYKLSEKNIIDMMKSFVETQKFNDSTNLDTWYLWLQRTSYKKVVDEFFPNLHKITDDIEEITMINNYDEFQDIVYTMNTSDGYIFMISSYCPNNYDEMVKAVKMLKHYEKNIERYY